MLRRLILQNVRCFRELDLAGLGDCEIFTGANAQGKTTILESVCLLFRLQSPRTRKRLEWMTFGKDFAMIEGRTDRHLLRLGQGRSERRHSVDEKPVEKTGDYLQATGLVVWMGNEDMALVQGGGEARRGFLDFLGSQMWPGYRRALSRFEGALRQRNRLLKMEKSPCPRELEALSIPMVEAGELLSAWREDLCQRLTLPCQEALQVLSGSRDTLALHYEPGKGAGDYASELLRARDKELRIRQTVVGPHRDDMGLVLNGHPARMTGSEGQQRSLAIALKLAQARLLEEAGQGAPLILLDDVFGELDPDRRRAFLTCLPAGSQKLIATTSMDWRGGLIPDAGCWQVGEGTARRS